MRNWEDKWPEARPKWGTFSVLAHQDLGRLISDVLLYDAVVFPTPVDDADVRRWEKEGWNPELLAQRINQLGDVAFARPWDPPLRAVWSKEYEQHVRDFPNDPMLAFDLTAAIMAEQSFAQLVGPDDDRLVQAAADPPKIHPAFAARDVRARLKAGDARLELVAAFQDVRQAGRITGAGGDDKVLAGIRPEHDGVRLRLQLAAPQDATEDMFHRVLDIVGQDDFLTARRRLWSWEQLVSDDKLDEQAAQLALDGLIRDYNEAVRRHVRKTRLETVFLLVPALLGAGIDAAVGGGWAGVAAGVGFNFAVDKVKAKFPILGEAGAAISHHPGGALIGAVSVVAHD